MVSNLVEPFTCLFVQKAIGESLLQQIRMSVNKLHELIFRSSFMTNTM